MAILRAKEITKLSAKERSGKLADLKKDLMKIRTQAVTGSQKVGKIREIKRTIARMLTLTKFQMEEKNKE